LVIAVLTTLPSDVGAPVWVIRLAIEGSNYLQQQTILNNYGIANDVIQGYNETGIANLLRGGRGVMLSVNAGILWK
jgi:hypothetical protein